MARRPGDAIAAATRTQADARERTWSKEPPMPTALPSPVDRSEPRFAVAEAARATWLSIRRGADVDPRAGTDRRAAGDRAGRNRHCDERRRAPVDGAQSIDP